LRGREETVEFIKRFKRFEEAGTNLSTTTVNSFELYYGARRSKRREKNLGATKALLTRLVILDLTN
jgi:predicted nucleic acid-binding protein